jgi:hypothetical protein
MDERMVYCINYFLFRFLQLPSKGRRSFSFFHGSLLALVRWGCFPGTGPTELRTALSHELAGATRASVIVDVPHSFVGTLHFDISNLLIFVVSDI